MDQVWQTYGGVIVGWLIAVPIAALIVWGLIGWRRQRGLGRDIARRHSLTEVGVVLGTVPWVWMTMLPSDDGKRYVNLAPLQGLAEPAAECAADSAGGQPDAVCRRRLLPAD